jgi:RNA polymerase sigma-70 factor, ECF subfamily
MTARAPEGITGEGDDQAVARVLAGETAAFRVLVERYQVPVLRLVRSLAPRSTAHEDLAQEAFVAAFVALPTFDGQRGRFASWLFTIAKNKCLNAQKKMGPVFVAEPPAVVVATTPADELARAEVRRSLDAALDALPEDLRATFVLAEIVGVPADQIAEMEGVSPGTIRSRLSRARASLRATLEPLQRQGDGA